MSIITAENARKAVQECSLFFCTWLSEQRRWVNVETCMYPSERLLPVTLLPMLPVHPSLSMEVALPCSAQQTPGPVARG